MISHSGSTPLTSFEVTMTPGNVVVPFSGSITPGSFANVTGYVPVTRASLVEVTAVLGAMSPPDSNSANDQASLAFTFNPCDLAVSLEANTTTFTPGQRVQLSVIVRNVGSTWVPESEVIADLGPLIVSSISTSSLPLLGPGSLATIEYAAFVDAGIQPPFNTQVNITVVPASWLGSDANTQDNSGVLPIRIDAPPEAQVKPLPPASLTPASDLITIVLLVYSLIMILLSLVVSLTHRCQNV